MSLRDGLHFYYPLNEGVGTVAYDVSGNNRHGTISNGAWGAGRLGRGCATFNGSSTIVYPPSLPGFVGTTIAFWAQITTLGGGAGFYNCGSYTGSVYARYWSNGLIWSGFHNQGAVYPSGTSTMNYGGWHHIAWAIDAAANEYLYTDGFLLSSGTALGTPFFTGFYFGGDDTGYMNGNMSDAAIWNRVLDPSEIAQLYRAGQGNPYPFPTPNLLRSRFPSTIGSMPTSDRSFFSALNAGAAAAALLACATAMSKSFSGWSGITSISGRANAQAKDRAAGTFTLPFVGRSMSVSELRAVSGALAALQAKTAAQAKSKGTVAGVVALLGRAVAAARALGTLTAGGVQALFARSLAMTKMSATATGKISLSALSKSASWAKMLPPGAIALFARSIAAAKTRATSAAAALMSVRSEARAKTKGGIAGIVGLLARSRAAAATRDTMAAIASLASVSKAKASARGVAARTIFLSAVSVATARLAGIAAVKLATGLFARALAIARSRGLLVAFIKYPPIASVKTSITYMRGSTKITTRRGRVTVKAI